MAMKSREAVHTTAQAELFVLVVDFNFVMGQHLTSALARG